jgi:hypothetical protein
LTALRAPTFGSLARDAQAIGNSPAPPLVLPVGLLQSRKEALQFRRRLGHFLLEFPVKTLADFPANGRSVSAVDFDVSGNGGDHHRDHPF